MGGISSYIAKRYLRRTAFEHTTSTMVHVCFISILIGAFSLTLVTAIMRGFEVTMHAKMQGVHAPVTIDVEGDIEDAHEIAAQLAQTTPEVNATSISATTNALIITQESGQPTIVMVKGVRAEPEAQVSAIANKIISSENDRPFTELLVGNHVVIGEKLADAHDLEIGSTLPLSYAHSVRSQGKKVLMKSKDAIVSGIFKTGIDDLDSTIIYAPLAFVESFDGAPPVIQVGLSIAPEASEQSVISKIKKTISTAIYSWKERYSSLMAALMLEKYAMFLVIALITLVASMNIVSLLFMHITNKQGDIAILKTMGMSNKAVRSIFLQLGLGIAAVAAVAGIALACGVIWILQNYPLIELPDVYHTSHLPTHLDWFVPPLVFAVVMLISALATWLPTRRINSINISHVLRFEG